MKMLPITATEGKVRFHFSRNIQNNNFLRMKGYTITSTPSATPNDK